MRNEVCLLYRSHIVYGAIWLMRSHRELISSLFSKISATVRSEVSGYYSISFSILAPINQELAALCLQISEPFQLTHR